MTMSRPLLSCAVAFALLGFGCTNDPGVTPGVDGGGGGTDAPMPGTDAGPGVDAAGPGGECFTLNFPTVTIAASTEPTQCVVMRLSNLTAIHVGQIVNTLGAGSHHFIVYRTADTTERPTPFDCTPFLDTLNPANGSPLMITQRTDETLTLPTGVGFTFEPNQMIRLEMHAVNFGTAPIDVTASAEFCTIPDADFTDEADFLFIGTPDISLPPRTTTTIGPMLFTAPSELAGANFFGITGHTHQFGTNVRISTAASASGARTSVYDVMPWSWDEPETVSHNPPFTIPSGGGFEFECDYDNTSDATVTFGESAMEEMCFFWAYYYPSVGGGRVCIHTTRGGSPIDVCCPGGALCSLISGFLGG